MQLRLYQQEAETKVFEKLQKQPSFLLQAATGAGKTIIFSHIIKQYREMYPDMRIAVLAHREQLIRQTYDKLLAVWPEGKQDIGIACSSVSKSMGLDKPVLIGTPQTLANRTDQLHPFHLLMVDECHRIPPQNVKSQYAKLINKLLDLYPTMRLLGLTATPYRLDTGYIYGDFCKKGTQNWFKTLDYSITTKSLIKQNYLVKYILMERDTPDLSNVRKVGREFNDKDLEKVMSQEIHLKSAVHTVKEYAKDRSSIVVFCVTIKHAEILCEIFKSECFNADCIHSQMEHEKRLDILERFDNGDIQVLCNVDVLTEGWDCTRVDCMLLCRPTMSTAKYVQMIGRGLRLHDGKTDCLILDLAGNIERHGDPNKPTVHIPGYDTAKVCPYSKKKINPENEECSLCIPKVKEVSTYLCPKCSAPVYPSDIVCPACGAVLKNINNDKEKLVERNFDKEQQIQKSGPPTKSDLLLQKGIVVNVLFSYVARHVSRKGYVMLKILLTCQSDELGDLPFYVQDCLDIEGNISNRWKYRAQQTWMWLTKGSLPPQTIENALQRKNELKIPNQITVKKTENGYINVEKYCV